MVVRSDRRWCLITDWLSRQLLQRGAAPLPAGNDAAFHRIDSSQPEPLLRY